MKTYDFHSHVIPETIIAAMRADPATREQLERYGKVFKSAGIRAD